MSPTEHVCAAHEDKIFCFAAIGDKDTHVIYSNLTGIQPLRHICAKLSYSTVDTVVGSMLQGAPPTRSIQTADGVIPTIRPGSES
jgi:hypothetical protein